MRLFASSDFLSRYVAYLALALVIIVFGVLAPDRFLTTGNLEVFLQNTAVLCIVAIGMTFIIIGGSIDLSVGSVMALSGAITASFTAALGAWAFVVSPIVGTILGVISGCIFVFGRIPSFVVSLGMLSMACGATILYTGGTPVSIPLDSAFYVFGTPPAPFIIAAVTSLVATALMRYTTFGRHTYAIGGDEEKSRILGVPVDGVKIAMVVLSGLCAGVGGGVLTSQLGSGSPTVGVGFELLAMSAVVIGGTPLTGGMGNIIGTVGRQPRHHHARQLPYHSRRLDQCPNHPDRRRSHRRGDDLDPTRQAPADQVTGHIRSKARGRP